MRAARACVELDVQLALQRADERGEEIEEQPVAALDDVAQVVLHQRAEDDGPHALLGSPRD